MKQGLQYKRTDRAIVNAFIKLVNQGSFEKLTVQEILDEALVSRNTFYSHYRDKYDIAEHIFEQFKQDFLDLLKESYTSVGKEWAGTEKYAQYANLPTQEFLRFDQEHQDVISALGKIKTDKVNSDEFISQLFQNRYLNAPSNQMRLTPERDLSLESEIYAAVFRAISNHYTKVPFFDSNDPHASLPNLDETICHAFLFSMGIIEENCEKEAFASMMQIREKAHKLKDNYQ